MHVLVTIDHAIDDAMRLNKEVDVDGRVNVTKEVLIDGDEKLDISMVVN